MNGPVTGTVEQLWEGGYLAPIDRHFAAAMARLAGGGPPAVEVGAALASHAVQRGHVCVELRRLAGGPAVTSAGQAVEGFAFPGLADWRAALLDSSLVDRASADSSQPADRPLVLDGGDRLYLARYWLYQQGLATALLARADEAADVPDPARLEKEIARTFPPGGDPDPQADQRRAARVACQRRLAVISGGPGTGKTSTVVRIMGLLADQAQAAGRAAPRFALLAPTGKAAARLAESVRATLAEGDLPWDRGLVDGLPREASTLHRALGYDPARPTRFRHDADQPLAADVVVVDEASMVDLALMAKLVEAVPAAARLILLGDRDQLASVEAGAILGDVCPPAAARPAHGPLAECVVELGHSWRFGPDSSIGKLARAINAGEADAALGLLAAADEPGVSLVPTVSAGDLPGVLGPLIRAGYGPSLRADGVEQGQRRFERFRLLAALRSGAAGIEGLNGLVERLLQPEGLRAEAGFYPGRPIMVTRNDYGLGLFNGDVGLVLPQGAQGRLRAFFPGRDDPVSVARLPACETAFALTAHKSQGSEFDEIVLVLPPRPSPVVTRELLYTAVTRARERVTLVGSPEVLRSAIATPVQRASGLRQLLWGD